MQQSIENIPAKILRKYIITLLALMLGILLASACISAQLLLYMGIPILTGFTGDLIFIRKPELIGQRLKIILLLNLVLHLY